ncbi:MAG: hypothetical protein DMD91_11340 [Candidatus Rokuibacteriota bacterium]|nr:MAG: hypothetical protein DMD91_11340 [Candidatus Rokubacteria bacterium]
MNQIIVVIVSVLLAGCATGATSTDSAGARKELPRTIAVLPLVPPAKDREEPARIVGRTLYGSLAATPYDVLKPQVVEERLVRASLGDPRVAAAKDASELARILGVDGIVYGELTHWDRIFVGIYAQVASGAHIRLVNARTGQTLFERNEVRRSHAGGLATDPVSAAIQIAQSALKLREIELIRASDDLVRALVKDLPTPPILEARRPPAFSYVASDAAGRLLKLGDTVAVLAEGQPGAIGSFDIVPLVKNLAMEETREGVYVGRYQIKPGENAAQAFVVARIADRGGRVSEREDVLGNFTVDTLPPATPARLSVSLKDRTIEVSWERNSESDLAGYHVYRSDSALTGFQMIASPEAPLHHESFDRLAFYRVAAVDRAGNESPPSPSVALPVLASSLTGVIDHTSYLLPSQSPYVIESTVTIDAGATLHILPGVTVRFAPGADGIVVKDGALIARGAVDQVIVFTSASARPLPGDFKVAVQMRTKAGPTSLLERIKIEHAAVGVRVGSGSVEVLSADISENLQAGVEVLDTGVLKLSESRIAGHRGGGGVTVQGFGQVLLRRNHISDNGWAVVNYSRNPVDARENWWGTASPPESLFVGDVDRADPLTVEPSLGPR